MTVLVGCNFIHNTDSILKSTSYRIPIECQIRQPICDENVQFYLVSISIRWDTDLLKKSDADADFCYQSKQVAYRNVCRDINNFFWFKPHIILLEMTARQLEVFYCGVSIHEFNQFMYHLRTAHILNGFHADQIIATCWRRVWILF